jgi:plasmid stability protein
MQSLNTMIALKSNRGSIMASLTIRQLDEEVKKQLRLRAAYHGRSMEAEARRILTEAVLPTKIDSQGLATQIQQIINDVGSIELPTIERTQNTQREPVDFTDEAFG